MFIDMEIKKLRDLCTPSEIGIYGIPASAIDYSKNKIRYLRISDINDDGSINDNDKKSVEYQNIEKYLLKDNDIVFARTGNSTGRSYLYNPKDGKLAFAGFLIKYNINPSMANPLYIKYFAISNYYKQWINGQSSGSTRGNMSAQDFAECPIILPKRNQQNLLANILSKIDRKIELNHTINHNLPRLDHSSKEVEVRLVA